VYTAFSGSHQDAISKCLHQQRDGAPWQVAYLPIDPADIGRDYKAVIRVNSQSGKAGVAWLLERDFQLRLPRWLQPQLATLVQRESERVGGEVDSATVMALLQRHFVLTAGPAQLHDWRIERRDGSDVLDATVWRDGKPQQLHGRGDGAMAAFVDGWHRAGGQQLAVVDFSEHAIGAGTDARAAAYIQLEIDGQRAAGVAFDQDTVSAALMALLSAINHVRGLHLAG